MTHIQIIWLLPTECTVICKFVLNRDGDVEAKVTDCSVKVKRKWSIVLWCSTHHYPLEVILQRGILCALKVCHVTALNILCACHFVRYTVSDSFFARTNRRLGGGWTYTHLPSVVRQKSAASLLFQCTAVSVLSFSWFIMQFVYCVRLWHSTGKEVCFGFSHSDFSGSDSVQSLVELDCAAFAFAYLRNSSRELWTALISVKS